MKRPVRILAPKTRKLNSRKPNDRKIANMLSAGWQQAAKTQSSRLIKHSNLKEAEVNKVVKVIEAELVKHVVIGARKTFKWDGILKLIDTKPFGEADVAAEVWTCDSHATTGPSCEDHSCMVKSFHGCEYFEGCGGHVDCSSEACGDGFACAGSHSCTENICTDNTCHSDVFSCSDHEPTSACTEDTGDTGPGECPPEIIAMMETSVWTNIVLQMAETGISLDTSTPNGASIMVSEDMFHGR